VNASKEAQKLAYLERQLRKMWRRARSYEIECGVSLPGVRQIGVAE